MFDIDRELKKLHIEKRSVESELRRKVLHMAFEMTDSDKRLKKAVRRLSFAAVGATALVLAALVIFAVLPTTPAAYYTVDINPSISVAVDNADTVLFASAENSDAEKLLGELTLEGLSFEEALRAIVQQASASGYLDMDGHVLIGHFGVSLGLSQQHASVVVSDVAGDTVTVLVLESTKSDFEDAQKQNRSPGISLLDREANALDVKGRSQKELIDAVRGKKTGTANNKTNGGDNDANNGHAADTGKKQNSATQTYAAQTQKPGNSENAKENESDGAKQNAASQAKENESDNQKTSGQGQENTNNNRNDKEKASSSSGNSGQEDDNTDKGKPAVPGRS